ncbi:MAG: hypothetical protein EZS28_043866, partial [Streblomastix strix]
QKKVTQYHTKQPRITHNIEYRQATTAEANTNELAKVQSNFAYEPCKYQRQLNDFVIESELVANASVQLRV